MDKNISENITENIKIKFAKIKSLRNKIKERFVSIQKIKNEIKENYMSYVQKEKEDFFGLDSFHFQNKVIELEFQNMLKLYQFIDNRIYGDYYKLFAEIQKFLKTQLKSKQYETIKELKNFEIYPVYKDLDKFKTYDFDTINNIHQDIITILGCVKDIYTEIGRNIKEDMKQLSLGINIDNYIINCQYKNMVLLTTNSKFENYIQVYHKYHFELLTKFGEKLSLCYQHVTQNDKRYQGKENVRRMSMARKSLAFSESESDTSDDNSFSTTPKNSNEHVDNDFVENDDHEEPEENKEPEQQEENIIITETEPVINIQDKTNEINDENQDNDLKSRSSSIHSQDYSHFYDPSLNTIPIVPKEEVQDVSNENVLENNIITKEYDEISPHDVTQEDDNEIEFVATSNKKKRKKKRKPPASAPDVNP